MHTLLYNNGQVDCSLLGCVIVYSDFKVKIISALKMNVTRSFSSNHLQYYMESQY